MTKRILVFGMNENPGGVEAFIKNYNSYFNHTILQLDFLCNSLNKVAFEEELKQSGSHFYHITPRSQNPSKFYSEIKDFFKKHASDYETIWVNINSLANIDYLKYAKKYGIKRRIVHSHNSRNMDSTLRGLLHKWNKQFIQYYATDYWACAPEAAKWFYKGKTLEKSRIIHNAIPVEELLYSPEKGRLIQSKLGWEDKFIIGNVGRLHFQKNQERIIQIFSKFHKLHPDARLVLIGQGEDLEKLEEQVNELNIANVVYFAGVQYDIQAWLSSFDVVLFPSLFEGLSIAGLEAQANGVPLLAAEHIMPESIRINDNVMVEKLERDDDDWIQHLELVYKHEISRRDNDVISRFVASGYNIKTEARKLENELLI